MTSHEVDHDDVSRALRMAQHHLAACPFPPHSANVGCCALKMLRAALLIAWPRMDDDEIAVLMAVDDATEFARGDGRQYPIWWSVEVVNRMADALNPDRVPPKPKRKVKPVPAHLLALPGLPKCGPKRERVAEVFRTAMPERKIRPRRVTKTWDPPEAHAPRRETVQQVLPHWVTGDPAPGRSALDARRMAAGEVRA